MGSTLNDPALDQLPLSDAEEERIRDVSMYLGALRRSETSAGTQSPQLKKDQKPSLSHDITLTALTQLCVYRLRCNRAFVSLNDGQNQHIISEATATISLRGSKRHQPNDGLYSGVTTLDFSSGIFPNSIVLFTGQQQDMSHSQNTGNVIANHTHFIVRDLTLEDEFKDKPYVTGWPHFRFCAEVPIHSPQGYVIGSLCVVDDKPREDFDGVDALQEIADSIAGHLDNVRIVHDHAQSGALVRGSPDDEVSSSTKISSIAQLPAVSRRLLDKMQPRTLDMEDMLPDMAIDKALPLISRHGPSNLARNTSLLKTAPESVNPTRISPIRGDLLTQDAHSLSASSASTQLSEHFLSGHKPLAHPSLTSKLQISSKKHESIHVLIVDDGEVHVKLYSKYLSRLGHTCEIAANGLIGLNKYKESPMSFQLILMDTSLPVMNGMVMTTHIRAFERERALHPVTTFAVTRNLVREQQALSAGIDYFKVGPLRLSYLKEIIVSKCMPASYRYKARGRL